MIKLLMLLLISSNANALTCSVTAANGEKYYKHDGKTKTLGVAAKIKPCAVNPFLIVYDDNRGMKLNVNPLPYGPQPCIYLKVKGRDLQMYYADVYENGQMVCK